jgi:predicted transcriptional regulator
MATILEMAAQIVTSHASSSPLTQDELLKELQQVYASLKSLEAGLPVEVTTEAPALTVKQAFKKNEVICMVCGKGGMKTLTRHLMRDHGLKPGQYRKQFGIPAKQSLTAKSYSDARKQMAEERGLGDVLAKARATRMANLAAKKSAPAKKATPTKPAKAKATKPAKATKATA